MAKMHMTAESGTLCGAQTLRVTPSKAQVTCAKCRDILGLSPLPRRRKTGTNRTVAKTSKYWNESMPFGGGDGWWHGGE